MSKSERTVVIINGSGSGNSFTSHWEFDLSEKEEKVLEKLLSINSGRDEIVCAFLVSINKVEEFTFSTVEDANTALQLYSYDERNDDDRSCSASVIHRLSDLEKYYPQLIQTVLTNN